VKLVGPDGNTVLLGQRDRSASQSPADDDEDSPRFSLLKEAAALVAARGGTTATCQVTGLRGMSCQKGAEVKHPAAEASPIAAYGADVLP
jgi:hypothetical protein